VPILDHELIEWAAGLPTEARLRGREGKYLLKKAMEPYLPREVLYRPKMGFAVPLSSWFRGPLRERVHRAVLSPVLLDTGIFDERFLLRMVEEHQSGIRDFSAPLWSVLMFEAFCRKRENADRSASLAAPPSAGRAERVPERETLGVGPQPTEG
jgi:asparagine synthase (glutamine-hydrolysing)